MELQSLMQKSLSNFDLYNLFENKIHIITYKELLNFYDIEDVFYPYDVVFILYEQGPNYGHWVVLCWDKNKDIIYFFD